MMCFQSLTQYVEKYLQEFSTYGILASESTKKGAPKGSFFNYILVIPGSAGARLLVLVRNCVNHSDFRMAGSRRPIENAAIVAIAIHKRLCLSSSR